jgi:2-iminoacetate synthase
VIKTFTDRWRQLDWDDIRLRIHSKTAADVERALASRHPGREEMMALLSPAADAYLEPMAQRAQRLTRQRFGNTVSFYVPLYLSNLCANDCTYCGFSMSNRIKRKTLDAEEIARECAAIREMGFEHLLLVTGDNFLLIRFHGMYQQDDRDIRAERAEQKLEPRHAMLLRCRLPGGIITTKQWQAIDKFA